MCFCFRVVKISVRFGVEVKVERGCFVEVKVREFMVGL